MSLVGLCKCLGRLFQTTDDGTNMNVIASYRLKLLKSVISKSLVKIAVFMTFTNDLSGKC